MMYSYHSIFLYCLVCKWICNVYYNVCIIYNLYGLEQLRDLKLSYVFNISASKSDVVIDLFSPASADNSGLILRSKNFKNWTPPAVVDWRGHESNPPIMAILDLVDTS